MRSATTHSENQTTDISASGMTSMAIPDSEFSAVRFCSYTVCGTKYDRLLFDSYASCLLLWEQIFFVEERNSVTVTVSVKWLSSISSVLLWRCR